MADEPLLRDRPGNHRFGSIDPDSAHVQNMTRKNFTKSLLFSIFACVIGSSYQFGFNTGVLNAPQKVIEKFINETYTNQTGHEIQESTLTLLWSITVSIYCIGGMIGGFAAGYLCNGFGRKRTMLANILLNIVAGVMAVLSKYFGGYELLIAGRFMMGINCGISTGVAPLYLSEIAPTNLRGTSGTINQFAIVVGILVAQVLGLKQILGTSDLWPYLVGTTLIPSVIQLLCLPCCPETPQYLMVAKGDRAAAEKALIYLRQTHNVQEELDVIEEEYEKLKSETKLGIRDLFRVSSLRQPLLISVMMMLSQQLSGINAVVYYSTSIFERAGLSIENAQYATLGTSVVNVVMTFVSAVLIDHLGRRTLHLHGLGGMLICTCIISVGLLWQNQWPWASYICIAGIMLYFVAFAIGPGSIPWFYVAELFSQSPRAPAVAVAVLVNWFANFLVGFGFPVIQKTLENYAFVPFLILLGLFWTYTYIKAPETKNRSIEEITAIFRDKDDLPGYSRLTNNKGNDEIVKNV
ncbi:unnamed protein product [Owenia fusiformis]|uniref:Uncharacterized protein n=1 Tax=Owenia fusiformis TaxID=6347 RepID=A0A8J1XHB9_OWEFU|nr:unnamed protein product [Owenia fusiformis]